MHCYFFSGPKHPSGSYSATFCFASFEDELCIYPFCYVFGGLCGHKCCTGYFIAVFFVVSILLGTIPLLSTVVLYAAVYSQDWFTCYLTINKEVCGILTPEVADCDRLIEKHREELIHACSYNAVCNDIPFPSYPLPSHAGCVHAPHLQAAACL